MKSVNRAIRRIGSQTEWDRPWCLIEKEPKKPWVVVYRAGKKEDVWAEFERRRSI